MTPAESRLVTHRAANAAIAEFVRRVKERAAQNIRATGSVTYAYRNAMRSVAKEMKIEIDM